ncbi:hypothetical protein AHiyo1_42290 [Arthrobacter sp. Hiyo1]|uniref:hypothetical protein n=1 Tax=Arthrobacter sp. Hiyo1 TaxID=1588020 RepID=UPI0006A3A82D|nr:hypothetical protein AHiyo1_42290 [Arthrobacter sp. Hiyo1]
MIRKKTPVKAGLAAELACEVCGRLPEAPKHRLTLASIAAMVPLELTVNTLAVKADLPSPVKVLVLTVATSLLGIWVAEPSVRRLMRSWLHAPALRHRRRLTDAPALWRARTYLEDQPGALQRVTRALRARISISSASTSTDFRTGSWTNMCSPPPMVSPKGGSWPPAGRGRAGFQGVA